MIRNGNFITGDTKFLNIILKYLNGVKTRIYYSIYIVRNIYVETLFAEENLHRLKLSNSIK